MINIILGIILEAAMTTRAAMDASKLGAKKMLFVLGKTQPSDWASKKIHEHKTTCGGERKDTITKLLLHFFPVIDATHFPLLKLHFLGEVHG